jgi:hypothetical protein
MITYVGGSDHVIHPLTVLDVTTVQVRCSEREMQTRDLQIAYRLGAAELPPQEGKRVVLGSDITAVAIGAA